MPLISVGSQVSYAGVAWKVAAIGWVGERYYWLQRGKDIAMIPAAVLEEKCH